MLHKSWPNIVTVSCLIIVAIIEALEQAISQSPHLASALPHINGAWHYLPLIILMMAGVVWLFGRFQGKPSPHRQPPLPDAFSDPRWQIVSGRRFENESIHVDGKSFRSCTFKNVTFLFHGTAPTEFTGSSQFAGSIRLSTNHPPTMFWRTLEHMFSTIPGAEIETSPVDHKGQKVEPKVTGFQVAADDEAQLSLGPPDGEIHSYDPAGKPYFVIRSCCLRFLRNIRFDPIESRGGHKIWLDGIASLAPGERVSLGFRAGEDGEYRGVVNHLINFFEGGSQPPYQITIHFLDGPKERTERHTIEGHPLPSGAVSALRWLRP